MKKLLILIGLIAYAFGDACSDCTKACDELTGFINLFKRRQCSLDCLNNVCIP